MSKAAAVRSIAERHLEHRGDPSASCDACRLLGFVAEANDALRAIQERSSKGQLDPDFVAEWVRRGLA
jgi:hypothetical protein